MALELGGKNPQVIFPDADLESAADAVVFGLPLSEIATYPERIAATTPDSR